MIHPHRTTPAYAQRAIALLLCLLCLLLCAPARAAQEAATHDGVRYTVDFDYLAAALPRAVAWLYQPDAPVNAPVMCHESEPTFYLRRQFDGLRNGDGALFVRDAGDLSAQVVTICGVNRWDNSLFGSLSLYREENYYRDHPTFYLLTPQGDYRLDVFAAVRTRIQDGEDGWRVPQGDADDLMHTDLPAILARSFIEADPALLPEEGDRWAMLCNDSVKDEGSRYVLYARMRPLAYAADAPVAYVNQLEMDRRDSVSGPVSIPGLGQRIYYAQNDPLWRRLVFEAEGSQKQRPFGDGGCGPTAVAMALANLLPPEQLCRLGDAAATPLGYRFCPCSVNDLWCLGQHVPYQLTTPQEYLRYLPLAVGSYAAGNNRAGVYGRSPNGFGTSMEYIYAICEAVGVSATQTYDLQLAVDFLRGGEGMVIACTSGHGSPFTASSHFLTLAGADDRYLYVLDPLQRETYGDLDERDVLEVLSPGVVRVKLEDAVYCRIAPLYLLKRADP